MYGLLAHSNFSLESVQSSRPSSIASFSTAATAHGIGSQSGRVIYAVGEAALRGIENIIIRRNLSTILSRFPHYDAEMHDMSSIYNDVLELSRYVNEPKSKKYLKNYQIIRAGVYNTSIQKYALRVLIVQISTCHTRHLIDHLAKWPSVEIGIFLAEVMACMPLNW